MSTQPWYESLGKKGVHRILKPRTVLGRVIKKLENYDHLRYKRVDDGWSVRVYRHGAEDERYVELVCLPADGHGIRLTCLNVVGWFSDVKEACKKSRIRIIQIHFKETE